jgi:hypothetical protein
MMRELMLNDAEVRGLYALLLVTDAPRDPHRRRRPTGATKGTGPVAMGPVPFANTRDIRA